MIDDSAPRRAYFASVSTPDLIVFATVELSRYDATDLDLIRQELVRRGVNVERLAVPTAPFGDILRITPAAFSTPLPGAWYWWTEGWQVFSRYLGYLCAMAAVLTLPVWIIHRALGQTHDRDLSIGALAHVLFIVALDSLVATAVFAGVHRRMSEGTGSVGMAIASGIVSLGRVFRESLKVFGLAFGPSMLLFAAGQTNDETGLKVFAWLWFVFPGSYLLIRAFWVQPLAICKRGEKNLFALSRRYSRGRVLQLYWFLHLTMATFLLGIMGMMVVKAVLPGPVLEPLALTFVGLMMQILTKVTVLLGYYHVSAHPDAKPQVGASQALPTPPGLPPQPS